jgi:nitronate monooxygenase
MKRFIEGADRIQFTLLPECLDDWVDESNTVRVVDAFVDALDLKKLGFDGVVPEVTGRPSYHPSALLKLYIYGYLNRVQSSRRLEREAKRNLEVIWLVQRLTPDDKTIADFRKDNGPAIKKVCARFVELCRQMGLLTNPERIDQEFLAAGNARVGCGFITWSLARQPHLLAQALNHKPAAVLLSFGDARPFAAAIKNAGAALICQVQTVTQAMEALSIGTDIVVAQGTEAGGHGATRSTLALVPAVVDAVRERNGEVVVVAAGGIADGRGLAAALMLGAQGALLGTRFLASDEALTSPAAKAKLVAASGDDTIRTRVFDIVRSLDWPALYTGRALQNAFSRQWHGREAELANSLPIEAPRYARAAGTNDLDTSVIFAGECVDLIRDVKPAAAIVASLVHEAEAALRSNLSR